MKIQNYGDWDSDARQGHHPPNCTCYRCNERSNPMNYDHDRIRGYHPAACTCVGCVEAARGRRGTIGGTPTVRPAAVRKHSTATTEGGVVKRVLIGLGVTALLTIGGIAVYLFG